MASLRFTVVAVFIVVSTVVVAVVALRWFADESFVHLVIVVTPFVSPVLFWVLESRLPKTEREVRVLEAGHPGSFFQRSGFHYSTTFQVVENGKVLKFFTGDPIVSLSGAGGETGILTTQGFKFVRFLPHSVKPSIPASDEGDSGTISDN